MATIGADNPTLADVAKRLDPDGKVDRIVELLNERNEILDDMTSMEGNLPTGHRVTQRTGLPTATARKLNQGIDPGKSTTAQIDEAVAEIAARSVVDVELANLNGNTSQFRLSESRAFLEGLNQKVAELTFYGNSVDNPAEFVGLGPRYDDLGAENGEMIIDAGGTGSDNNTSIWLVVWGPESVFSAFPKGSTAGIQHSDMGIDYEDDRDNKKFRAYRDHWMWKIGLVLKDWRFVSRTANIDTSDLKVNPDPGVAANLIENMTRMAERITDLNAGRPVFYCSRTVRETLRLQTMNANNVRFGLDDVAGRKVLTFDGIPVRRVDQILDTESRITDSTAS